MCCWRVARRVGSKYRQSKETSTSVFPHVCFHFKSHSPDKTLFQRVCNHIKYIQNKVAERSGSPLQLPVYVMTSEFNIQDTQDNILPPSFLRPSPTLCPKQLLRSGKEPNHLLPARFVSVRGLRRRLHHAGEAQGVSVAFLSRRLHSLPTAAAVSSSPSTARTSSKTGSSRASSESTSSASTTPANS